MKAPINKNYVSEIDIFLSELRAQFPESNSQKKERKKYDVINLLRDVPSDKKTTNKIMEEF